MVENHPSTRVWLSTINPMATVLYYTSYLIGLTSAARVQISLSVLTKTYKIREISPGEYVGSNFFLIASGTIRSGVRATPPKLKPCPFHAPNRASLLRRVYSNFNEHKENTERLRVCTTIQASVASVGAPRRVATYIRLN